MKVKVLSLSAVLTLCKPMDCSPPNSSVHRILQARILKWLAIPFSRASSRCKDWTHVSCIQFSSLAQSCLTLCNPMDCSTPGLPVHHQLRSLLKLRSIRSVMPSNHLILCCPLLLPPSTFPSIRVFSNESVLRIRWPQYWSFSFSISPSNEYSGLTSFRRTGWIPCSPRDSQESSPTPQFKSINSLVLSFLYSPTLTSIHDYWKNHSFD